MYEGGTKGYFYNVTFQGLGGKYGGALSGWYGDRGDIDEPLEYYCSHCRFIETRGDGAASYATIVGMWKVHARFHDCIWERNLGGALYIYESSILPTDFKVEVIRCIFRDNAGCAGSWPGNGAAVIANAGGHLIISDTIIERSTGSTGLDGCGMAVIGGAGATMRNVSILSNKCSTIGGGLSVASGSSVTMTDSLLKGNEAETGSGFILNGANLFIYNSTIAASTSSSTAPYDVAAESHLVAKNVLFRDGTAIASSIGGFQVTASSTVSLTDCVVYNHYAFWNSGGVAFVADGSTFIATGTVFEKSFALGHGGCFKVNGGGSFVILDDCDMIGCSTEGYGGAAMVSSSGSMSIANSRITGSYATTEGAVAHVGSGGKLRIVSTTITNSSGGKFYIVDDTGDDWAVQLDTVDVDDTTLYSESAMLVQNCKGFDGATSLNASVATCESTSDFCLRESCANDVSGVGIECICLVDGVPAVRLRSTKSRELAEEQTAN